MFGIGVAKRRIVGLKADAGSFDPIDAIELGKKMDLAERGRNRGAKNLPAPDSSVFDDIEQEIVNRLSIECAEARSKTMNQCSTYSERLNSIRSGGDATEYRNLAVEAKTAFSATIQDAKNDLFLARRKVVDSQKDLAKFRALHNLEHSAHTADFFKSAAILLVIFAVETVPSAKFLSENDSQGLLGGWISAASFSFLNLSMSFIAGYWGWRLIKHKKTSLKIAGVAITAVLTSLVIAMNFLLSHFRTASLSLPQAEAVQEAFKIFSNSPFHLADVNSVTMIGLGFVLAFIAMFKGYSWDDPYIGYGKVWRARDVAEKHYRDTAQAKMDEIRDEQDAYVYKIKAARSSLRNRRDTLPIITEQRKRLIDGYEEHMKHLQQVGHTLLSIYRENNRAARTDSSAPKHFGKSWQMPLPEKIEVPSFDTGSLDNDTALTDKALEESVNLLHGAFQEAMYWIENIGTIEQDIKLNEQELSKRQAA